MRKPCPPPPSDPRTGTGQADPEGTPPANP